MSAPVFALADPFSVSAALGGTAAAPTLTVSFRVPPRHYLYAGEIAVEPPAGVALTTQSIPAAKAEHDVFTDSVQRKHTRDVSFVYRVEHLSGDSLPLTVRYQGCGPTTCFFPATRRIVATFAKGEPAQRPAVTAGSASKVAPPPPQSRNPEPRADWRNLARDFRLAGKTTGYVGSRRFLAFLDKSERGGGSPGGDVLERLFQRNAIWLAILLILAGGLALNLTPCVLPLIPINLAIIGAGAHARSNATGFLRGGLYGAGMAAAYGVLGVVAALTGATFGTLNASPWFNFAAAALFIVLALAMFDVIDIDLSRFRPTPTDRVARRLGYATPFFMGGMAALLAGACVAPVVISVLLIAGNLYGAGNRFALLLPFLLGLGMALPWPFVGAGLSLLPKPGKWMTRVKALFGVFILLLALYYGREGYSLLRNRIAGQPPGGAAEAQAQGAAEGGWSRSLPEALGAARREGKPLLIDFWASWCKNCLAMDRTTFRDPAVNARLGGFVRVKFRAENPDEPATREALDYFGVRGLPSYVVLKPAAREGGKQDVRTAATPR